jgi:hypothetical protein
VPLSWTCTMHLPYMAGEKETLVPLVALRELFSRALPKMATNHVASLVFDPRQCVYSRRPKDTGRMA